MNINPEYLEVFFRFLAGGLAVCVTAGVAITFLWVLSKLIEISDIKRSVSDLRSKCYNLKTELEDLKRGGK